MSRIYLDTNVWCRPFDKPSERISKEVEAFFVILEEASSKRYILIGSVVLDVEVGNIEKEEKKVAVEGLISLFTSQKVLEVSESEQREIRKSVGLKIPDASHIACAIRGESEYFISCDDEMLRKGKEIEERYGIKVCNPIEFIRRERRWRQRRRM
jgi:predicted nucleic acid-binding protein